MRNDSMKSVFRIIALIIFTLTIFTAVTSLLTNSDEPVKLDVFAGGFVYVIYGILAIQIALALYLSVIRSKIKAEDYADDEDSTFGRMEKRISLLQGIGSALAVALIPIFYGIMYYGGINIPVFVAFIVIATINFLNEVATIRCQGKINPKLDVDWSKFSMNKDLYQGLDECEKELIGKIGAKIIYNIHNIFAFAFIAVLLLGNLLDFSGYEAIIVGLLWGGFTLFIAIQKYKLS